MRYPEQIIARAISSNPATARLLGFNVFPMIVPQSVALPFVTYQRTSVTRLASLGNAVGVPITRLELNIFSASYSETREIADAARELLDHYRTTTQGVTVSNVTIEAEAEDVVALEGGDLPPAWHVQIDLDIQWKEL